LIIDANLTKIRQWLSPPDPSLNYYKALERRQNDTGLWFLNGDEYAGWKTDAGSAVWLNGIPGCGKTILSSTIIQDMFQYCDDGLGRMIAYFYFDFNDARKQAPALMLRSLVNQLSHKCVKIPASLAALFHSCDRGQQHPSQDALLVVLQAMILEFPQSYLVLDALDECTDRAALIDVLETILGWQLDKLHLLVTSRKERDIESSLEEFLEERNIICLQSSLVDDDIKKYVHQRLSDDKRLRKWQKDPKIAHEIESTLMKRAHGMYVYILVT
jgi:NACHT domain